MLCYRGGSVTGRWVSCPLHRLTKNHLWLVESGVEDGRRQPRELIYFERIMLLFFSEKILEEIFNSLV